MKSPLKIVSLLAVLIFTLALTACSRQRLDITVENGNEVIIQTDQVSFTRQELLETLSTIQVNGMYVSLQEVLDWADYTILSEQFEISEDDILSEIEFLQMMFEPDALQEILLSEGYASIDDWARQSRLTMLRQEAMRQSVNVTEEEIQTTFDSWFADDIYQVPEGYEPVDLDTLEPYEPNLEDYRESITNWIIDQVLAIPGYGQKLLVEIRAEAGFTLHSRFLQDHYQEFVDAWNMDIDINDYVSSDEAVASIDGATLSVDEFFEVLITKHTFSPNSPILTQIDTEILSEVYDADHDEVRRRISQAKVSMVEWFYPQMAQMGLNTEQEIFNHFLFLYLQEQAIDANFQPDEAVVQELFENFVPRRHVRHILVEDYETAEDLIAQLQAVDGEEVLALFTELAAEYGQDGTSATGGSLGFLSLPSGMVADFEGPAFELEEGEISPTPVETEFGYHVIYVEEVEPMLTLAQVREQEAQRIRQDANLFTHFIMGLRAEHALTINHPQLEAQYNAAVSQVTQAVEGQQ